MNGNLAVVVFKWAEKRRGSKRWQYGYRKEANTCKWSLK